MTSELGTDERRVVITFPDCERDRSIFLTTNNKPMTKIILKGTGILLGVILFFTSIAFFTGNLNLLMKEYFGVRSQNIETRIYKETEMYNEGKIQELAKAKLEYEQADPVGQKAIGSMIRHRFADYESDRLPDGLAQFLTQIRGY